MAIEIRRTIMVRDFAVGRCCQRIDRASMRESRGNIDKPSRLQGGGDGHILRVQGRRVPFFAMATRKYMSCRRQWGVCPRWVVWRYEAEVLRHRLHRPISVH
jgi:hypothetical protein